MSFLHPGFATAFELANRAESLAVWTKAVLFKDQVKSQGKKRPEAHCFRSFRLSMYVTVFRS
jgi:hypothetical protein